MGMDVEIDHQGQLSEEVVLLVGKILKVCGSADLDTGLTALSNALAFTLGSV